MNAAIQRLSEMCEEHRFDEKLLFVPSYAIGQQITEHLAKKIKSWINLRVTTVAGYAQELTVNELGNGGIRLIDSLESLMIVEKLFLEDESLGGDDAYFQGAQGVPGIFKSLERAVSEIRLTGLFGDGLDPAAFIVQDKGEEFVRLTEAYESFLKENNLIDRAGVLAMAVDKLEKGYNPGKDRIVMIFSDFPLGELEKTLIILAGSDSPVVIPHTRPAGLKQPKRFFGYTHDDSSAVRGEEKDVDLLSRLFSSEEAAGPFGDGSVTLFHALGESNEVREVFRRVLKEGVRLDEVEILVSTVEPYTPFFYEIATALEVPATFAGGLPVTYTRPGRALALYLQWQMEEFAARHLQRLFQGGCLDMDRMDPTGERPTPSHAARMIRDAGVGWGRDRYPVRFKALEEGYRARAAEKREEGEEEKAGRLENTAAKVAWLNRYVEKILKTVPLGKNGDGVSIAETCAGAVAFLEEFCRVAGNGDVAARGRLVQILESMGGTPSTPLSPAEAAERVERVVRETRVGQSNPRPGHVHVAHYRSGGRSGRSRTFVVGLNQSRFPGTLRQDPVILDVERERLGPGMVRAKDLLEENTYIMVKTLGSLQGKVTLSYPCRDLLEDRELFPSPIVLNAYRLITGDREGDYRDLNRFLGEPVGFIQVYDSVPTCGWEWWLSQTEKGYTADSVLAVYKALEQGVGAETEREKEELSVYEGWVPSSKDTMDPTREGIVLSCSRLESLAKCPFAFFVQYVLGVEPLEEIERDMTQWLDPLQRGQLLHDVFCAFFVHLSEKGERPSFKAHMKQLERMAVEEVERWKMEVPPAGELAFNRELEQINQTLQVFLRSEEERCRDVEPRFFELSFGLGEEAGEKMSSAKPVAIKLKTKRTFRLRGRIDRVDQCGEHEYEVWDYKTGSAYGYKEEGYLNRGRHLQHALYSLATETLLRGELDKKASVVRAGYFFPSPRGEGRRILKDQRKREELFDVLEDLFELLREGTFPVSVDGDPCGICDFESICGGTKTAVARSKGRLATEEKMAPMRRLQDHD
ncbi:PD-(D/E)XK nuclease family protein [Thermodesulfobacteriota bacterium]